MKSTKRFGILACAAIAAGFLAPSMLLAFTTIGGSLGIGTSGNGYQRDVRVWNNAQDAAANNNVTPEANHPGALGAPLALWKAGEAWNSNNALAMANFDFDWQGAATSNSSTNGNTISFDTVGCGGSTLAYTETPISDGWRIIMCEAWVWSDGPGSPSGSQVDIQGVAAHELGHALGLGHSTTNCGACNETATGHTTMCAFICSNGVVERTIQTDDRNGLQSIYGTIPANKPTITSLGGSTTIGQTLIINGTNFTGPLNVKFTAGTSQNTGTIPGVVYNVSPVSATQIQVTVPATALDGNVLVWEPALSRLSNPFPIDINVSPVPTISNVSPANVPAWHGGTVTITGTNFSGTSDVTLTDNAGAVFHPSFTEVSATSVSFDSPTVTQLGLATVTVTTGFGTSNNGSFTYTDRFPPFLDTPTTHQTGTVLNWDFQGIAGNEYYLFCRRNSLILGDFMGCTGNILANPILLKHASFDALGIGHYQRFIAPSLAGLTIYSQVVDVDPFFQWCNDGSNIVQCTFQ